MTGVLSSKSARLDVQRFACCSFATVRPREYHRPRSRESELTKAPANVHLPLLILLVCRDWHSRDEQQESHKRDEERQAEKRQYEYESKKM